MHDLHESVPFMYTFSGQARRTPRSIRFSTANCVVFELRDVQMIKYGMPGVWTHGFVICGRRILGFMSSNHNGMLRMYETFGNGGANTCIAVWMADRKVEDVAARRCPDAEAEGAEPNHARVVSAVTTVSRSRVVDAQQHELHGAAFSVVWS